VDRCIAEAEVSRRREVKELKRYKNWQTTWLMLVDLFIKN
jgi:hypothetical protein